MYDIDAAEIGEYIKRHSEFAGCKITEAGSDKKLLFTSSDTLKVSHPLEDNVYKPIVAYDSVRQVVLANLKNKVKTFNIFAVSYFRAIKDKDNKRKYYIVPYADIAAQFVELSSIEGSFFLKEVFFNGKQAINRFHVEVKTPIGFWITNDDSINAFLIPGWWQVDIGDQGYLAYNKLTEEEVKNISLLENASLSVEKSIIKW